MSLANQLPNNNRFFGAKINAGAAGEGVCKIFIPPYGHLTNS